MFLTVLFAKEVSKKKKNAAQINYSTQTQSRAKASKNKDYTSIFEIILHYS